MRKTALVPIIIFVVAWSGVYATPQIPDVLTHKGVEYPLINGILEPYFARFPERKPETLLTCSASWRGYRAMFEVVDGTLALKEVLAEPCNAGTPSMKVAVPNGKRLFIDWYTGLLVSIHDRNDADPYGFAWLESSEKYSLFEIREGRLTKEKHFDNSGFKKFKERQFGAYKKTPEYQAELKANMANGRMTLKNAESNMRTSIFFNTKKFLVD